MQLIKCITMHAHAHARHVTDIPTRTLVLEYSVGYVMLGRVMQESLNNIFLVVRHYKNEMAMESAGKSESK